MILLLSAGALSPRLARPERDEQLRADCLQVRVQLTNVCLSRGWDSLSHASDSAPPPLQPNQLILSWTGARLEGGQYEKVNVNATDNRSSTCLHYAAAAGMRSCVEVRGQMSACACVCVCVCLPLILLSTLSARPV